MQGGGTGGCGHLHGGSVAAAAADGGWLLELIALQRESGGVPRDGTTEPLCG